MVSPFSDRADGNGHHRVRADEPADQGRWGGSGANCATRGGGEIRAVNCMENFR